MQQPSQTYMRGFLAQFRAERFIGFEFLALRARPGFSKSAFRAAAFLLFFQRAAEKPATPAGSRG